MAATVEGSAGDIPTLHHLNDSQSQRILWLLEELAIKYELVLYERDPKKRAPPSLRAISPLGKSPILVTSEGRAITESSAIAAYLLKTYDTSGQFAAQDWIRDEQLTAFAGASLGPIGTVELLFDLTAQHTPFPLSFIARRIRGAVQSYFTMPEFKRMLTWLENELGDKPWFNGDNLGRSDIMLSFPLDIITQRAWIDIGKDYPKLAAWKEQVLNRPAWKQGLNKGNGYALTW